jgi:hypothetical protein
LRSFILNEIIARVCSVLSKDTKIIGFSLICSDFVLDEPLFGIYGMMEGLPTIKPFRFEARLVFSSKMQNFHVYEMVYNFQEWDHPFKSNGFLRTSLKKFAELFTTLLSDEFLTIYCCGVNLNRGFLKSRQMDLDLMRFLSVVPVSFKSTTKN